MTSMTGYSYIEELYDDIRLSVEIKSLNNRFLDINIEAPYFLTPYELEIKKILSAKLKRGKIVLKIYVKEKNPNVDIELDLNLAKKYLDYFNNIINELKLPNNISLSHFLNLNGLIKTNTIPNANEIWKKIENTLNKSLLLLTKQRDKEGENTKNNILSIIENLKQNIELIKTFIPLTLEEVSKKLKNKLDSILKDYSYDDDRILIEAGIIASKSDINEEIQRIDSHLSQFIEICEYTTPVGKKLDFITQEILREVNTISSKSYNLKISKLVINSKNEIEKIKEQIRNIE